MSEPRYLVTEQYASGHEMCYDVHGPATMEQHGQMLPDYIAEGFPTRRDALDMLFEEGDLNAGGSTFIVSKVRDWVVVVTWQEPTPGISVFGPYTTPEEARSAIPKLAPGFVNPFGDEIEAAEALTWYQKHPLDALRYRTPEQCASMGFIYGGELPEDVEFEVEPIQETP